VKAQSVDQARKLDGFIDALTVVLALQSVSSGCTCDHILSKLGEALLRILDLRLVVIRLRSWPDGAYHEVLSLDSRYRDRSDEAALIAALQPWLSPPLGSASSLNYTPMGPEAISITSLELGSNGAWGKLVAGAPRASFPSDLERILLRVAGNQACVALMEDSHPMRCRETGPEDVVARAPQVNPNPTALKDNLIAELRSLARLHQFSTSLIAADDPTTVLEHMLDAAIDVQSADFGNVELFDAELGGLVIKAQRNLQPAFLNHLARVLCEDYARGKAAEAPSRVIIEDIDTDEGFAPHRSVAAEAGVRAMQSTPLISHRGELLGMLSTHFRKPHRPSDYELRLTDIFVQQAARMLEGNRTEEERYKLAAVVQNCFDFIGISTLDGKAMFINSAGRRMVGLLDDEPSPREISSYVADEAQERLKESLLVVEREGFWDGQTTFRHFSGGADLPVLQRIFYICEPNTGRRLALATVCRYISQRRRTELTLSKAQQELAHASRVLSIGELTASLAHEINQPLAAIVTNANAARRWLERKVPNYKRAKLSLESIVRDGNRASAIILRVRSFSAKTTPSRSALNINEVIREVVAFATHEISREHVELTTLLDGRLPIVIADRVELQQVVLNLVINSIEALRAVVERPKELVITSARRNRGTLEVSVRDNGTGIEPHYLVRMFDAFFTTKSNGMGLGLAISRRIVESYDGTLWVSRNPHQGLTMTFTLPLPRQRNSRRALRRPETARA
jgi:signal transduction histidine kinase